MVRAPFRELCPLIVFNSDFDLPQNLFTDLAHRRAQGCHCVPGIKIENTEEIFMLEVGFRLQPAAGHKGVGDADRGGVSECRANVKSIILFQKGTVNDIEDVMLMLIPVFTRQLRGDPLQLVNEAVLAGNIKAGLHRRTYHVPVLFITVLPEVWIPPGAVYTARVGNVKHIAEERLALAVVNECDALCAAPDIPAHTLIPEIIFRTGGGVWPLGVDHQLLREGIFLNLLSRGNVRF